MAFYSIVSQNLVLHSFHPFLSLELDNIDVLDSAEHSIVMYSQHFDQLRVCILTYCSLQKDICLIKAVKALVTRCNIKAVWLGKQQ